MDKNHFDVLIVGAGISGIGSGCHLQHKCPDKTFTILEGRAVIGGTWDLFRYPGIRSDSNMHTLSYKFRPWDGDKAIAEGESIREYVQDTAKKYGVDQHIRYHHRVKSASWSSEAAAWKVVSENGAGETEIFTCNFLHMCAGYYSYDKGYTPEFAGRENFKGEIIHPQHWPENFNAEGKAIIVIGSGATAITLIPALAQTAKHVVMLQRSPTYVVSLPSRDKIAHFLRRIMPLRWAQELTRRKDIYLERYFFQLAKTNPEKAKKDIIKRARKDLPQDFDMEKHFTPRYNPWDQRLCLVPDADLFKSISSGTASVVTDHIDHFTENGILLKSGEELKADVIITATGLNMALMGKMAFDVDGVPVDFSKQWIYKGMMYSDVPNMASVFGYINASWTLRADIQAEFLCRVLNHLDQTNMRQAMPTLRDNEKQMEPHNFVEGFSSGYIQRAVDQLPKQGDHEPWVSKQDYKYEKAMLKKSALDDGALIFSNPAQHSGGYQTEPKRTPEKVAVPA